VTQTPKHEGVSSPTLDELRAMDPADPATPRRIATILIQMHRHNVSAEEAHAILDEVRRLRHAMRELPPPDPQPPRRVRRRG
jgi:hypothetical protein